MDLRQLITDSTDSSLTVTGHVASTEAIPNNKNLVFSPLSINVVLSLIAAGSTGVTSDQLLTFLKSNSSDDLNKLSSELVSLVFADGSPAGGPKLNFANGLWVEQTLPLKPTFKQVVDDFYKAASNQADFLNKERKDAPMIKLLAVEAVYATHKRGTGVDFINTGRKMRISEQFFAEYFVGSGNSPKRCK